MSYFTLLSRTNKTSRWAIEFGDHDKECVQSELEDHVDHDVKKSNLKIISTKTQRQSEIDLAVAMLNQKEMAKSLDAYAGVKS